jgi:uncharacterized protein YciI
MAHPAHNGRVEHYIYRIRPTRLSMLTDGPTQDEARIVGEHFAYLKGLADTGRLFMAGRTLNNDEGTFGIAVFAAACIQDAEAVLADDPAVVQGVMQGEVFPFRVALWSGDPTSTQSGA